MIYFEWAWMGVLLPAPVLARKMLPAVTRGVATLRIPFVEDFADLEAGKNPNHFRRRFLFVASIAWALLITSAARPQWLGEPIALPITGRDLMLAVDLSESMRETDFQTGGRTIDRLAATKLVANNFINRRTGDRIGLILFADQAYLQVPLTFDRHTVEELLDEAVLGLVGKATAIGDAIGLAVKRYRDIENADKVLILMTDGANTAGVIEPVRAAELAAKAGLKIYTIGIGADEMVTRSLFGNRRVNPSADLDEEMLTSIADATGGRYFRARDTQELESIYLNLDKLEPVTQDPQFYRPRTNLYPWPLFIALLLGVYLLFGDSRGTLQQTTQR